MAEVLCQVLDKKILPGEFVQMFHHEGHGAEAFFFGNVRNLNHGKKVLAVSYDAFVPLAEQSFKQICTEALEKFEQPTAVIRVIHRIGRLDVGESSIAIGVSTPHRDAAYQINRYIIEEIKKRSPIWKKEHYLSGDSEWVQGHALCSH